MKRVITFILIFFFTLVGLILFYDFSYSKNDFKEKFEIISGFPFPSEGEIIEIKGCSPVASSDYNPCSGRFQVNKKTYFTFKEAIEKNNLMTDYKKKNIIGEWGLHSEYVIYFEFLEE